MTRTIRYIERMKGSFVSLEKAFREIATNLSDQYTVHFDQMPFSTRVYDAARNLVFFREKPADIYHITGHVNYMGLRFPRDRTVLSIMDVRFVNVNTGIRRFLLKKFYLDLPVRRLKYITAISANVRDEIVSLTGCRPDKVRVLDLPLLSHIRTETVKTFNTEMPLILQVGTMPNKNIANLARALSGLKCRLLIIGELDGEQRRVLAQNKISYESQSGITDEKIREAYHVADIVAFCSTYEGFGLPIIEAQAMKKPVVTSNISPMKETAGGGACLVDPFDPMSIRAGILKLIEEKEFRESLIHCGTENIKRYSPTKVAIQYESLYNEILEKTDSR